MPSGYVKMDNHALQILFGSVDGPSGKALAKLGVRVTTRAKQLAPVDTGRLRSSIAMEIGTDNGDVVVRVGTNVHYAPYLEFGTRRMTARPFMRPALDAIRGTVV